jgi:hypothetical protein
MAKKKKTKKRNRNGTETEQFCSECTCGVDISTRQCENAHVMETKRQSKKYNKRKTIIQSVQHTVLPSIMRFTASAAHVMPRVAQSRRTRARCNACTAQFTGNGTPRVASGAVSVDIRVCM